MFSVFELLERGEVLMVPTESPLEEQEAWITFRDVILGLEYRESAFFNFSLGLEYEGEYSLCRKSLSKSIKMIKK